MVEILGVSGSGKSTLVDIVRSSPESLCTTRDTLVTDLAKITEPLFNISLPFIDRFYLKIITSIIFNNYFCRRLGLRLLFLNNKVCEYYFNDFLSMSPTTYRVLKNEWRGDNHNFKSAYFGFLQAIVKLHVYRLYSDIDFLLVDEGPIKYLQSLLSGESNAEIVGDLVNELTSFFPNIEGLIIFEGRDYDIPIARMTERSGGRPFNFRGVSNTETELYLRSESEIVKAVESAAEKHGLARCFLSIDYSKYENAEKTIKFIKMLRANNA